MESMKTRFTRHLSIVLCIAILMSTLAFTTSAGTHTMNDSQWATYWNDYVSDGKAVHLAPGSDDTEMRFAWMSAVNVFEPIVQLSKNADMSGAVIFTGGYMASTGPEDGYSAHVQVSGLQAGTSYYYRCGTAGNMMPVNSFKTVAGNGDFSAIYVSDIHLAGEELTDESLIDGSKVFRDVLEEAAQKDDQIALIVSGGDQANSGRVPEYVGLFASPLVKTMPFALVAGNHDKNYLNCNYITNNPNIYEGAIAPSLLDGDYWFVKGDVLFVMLDSNNRSGADHYRFVQQAVDRKSVV